MRSGGRTPVGHVGLTSNARYGLVRGRSRASGSFSPKRSLGLSRISRRSPSRTQNVNDPTILNALIPLVGLPLRCIGRAADVLWVHFGEYQEIPSPRGGMRTVGEWALHVQCPWRITRPPLIIAGRIDLHFGIEGEEPFNWDENRIGSNRFDRLITGINGEFETSPPLVSEVVMDSVGGFTLRLERGYTLDVFPAENSESSGEHWRIFRPGVDSHFVFPDRE